MSPVSAGYEIPSTPVTAWTSEASQRRDWVSRLVLAGILLIQSLLSLRLRNSASEDESNCLFVGHMQLEHLRHGTAIPAAFDSYLSGSPVLYPVFAAAVDLAVGLNGIRIISLIFMLAATGLLYSLTRLLFNERVGLFAAASFAVLQSTLLLGNLATYNAAALFLLSLATWIVIRTARARTWVAALTAPPVLVLAIAVDHVVLLYVPAVLILAILAAIPHQGTRALTRGIVLPFTTAILAGGAVLLAGEHYFKPVDTILTHNSTDTNSPTSLAWMCLNWGGLLFAIALLGTILYFRQGRMGEDPGLQDSQDIPGQTWRLTLGLLLSICPLLAPAYHIHLHTDTSLTQHIGYGLLLAAPMAGVGITRIIGAHFRHPQLGIVVWVGLLALGMAQSKAQYQSWPDTGQLVTTLKPQLHPNGVYLFESQAPLRYYLRQGTKPEQWNSTSFSNYITNRGTALTGKSALRAAIADGHFDLIVLDQTITATLDQDLTTQLKRSNQYRLMAKIPYRTTHGTGFQRVWIKDPRK